MKQSIFLKSSLPKAQISHLRVFLRADLNVSLSNKLLDNYRLTSILPTIDMILQKGAKVILASHIGRPKTTDAKLSTKHLIPWFKKHGYKIEQEADLNQALIKSKKNYDTILLLENLRFFPGEQQQDNAFAKQLAELADFYVNDAFGTLHRRDTSITLLPLAFPYDKRTIGPLVEKELTMLNKLLANPESPFVFILGGGKIKDKLPLLENMIGLANIILLCPAIVFTFLKAQGKPVGKSFVDESLLNESKKIIDLAHEKNTQIIFPSDYQIAQETFTGELSFIHNTDIPNNSVGISIGEETIQKFDAIISQAKMVLFNGAIGNPNNPDTLDGLYAIFNAMAASKATTVICGGDSVAIAQKLGIAQQISYCSTGGGSTITYLSGEPLVGLDVFVNK